MDLLQLKKRLNEQVIGREREIDFMLIALLQGGHILLESVPGSGKTWMAKAFAASFDGAFQRIQFTPDVLPSDVTGIRFYNPKQGEFELRPGPVMTNLLLADEINRATPRTQSSLLEAMEEKQATIDGETVRLPDPFMVIATQNPVESQQGTFPLPAAQLDRFLFRLEIGYPSEEEELKIVQGFRGGRSAGTGTEEPAAAQADIRNWMAEARNVDLHEDIERYIVALIRASRQHEAIELGLSSRAGLALANAAQGWAFLQGRAFVTPDDVKVVFAPVSLHRIMLTPEGSLVHEPKDIVEAVLDSVSAPVEVM
ncbi:AAA family ATPase [Planococcus lenghuensis]|uniref:Magnesium chelatase n=1 Tax=Planococcus lenghuensis TaxID=2213202 RepID=A0A1Q2L0B2_9BACL|nr:MoxR family ATPase [Planococcus lenghuensis]AQQ53871.1 magnesium chelatase [Planococcus lenghuensis]